MTSSECLKMKKKYNSVKSKLQGAILVIDDCSSNILNASSFLQELIIDGKTFDDDKLKKDNSDLSDIKSNLQSIVNECNKKITYYDNLYKEALNKEGSVSSASSNTDANSNEKTVLVKKPVNYQNNNDLKMW